MISLNTWNTLFEGKYGTQELNILYMDDVFVSFLKIRDKGSALIQVYKVFLAKGDIEMFVTTLPYPALVYQKHVDIGESNNYKYLLLHTDAEYVDINTLSYHVDKKIQELNKRVGSVISVVKSYDIKLTSLKLATDKETNYFFSDPGITKVLTNLPLSLDLSSTSSMDKLILGKKNNILVTSTLENLNSVAVYGASLNERLFAAKVICENYLLSSKTVIVFDSTKMFVSLGYPNQDSSLLSEFDIKMDPFGFPVKSINYFDIKIPLSAIPQKAFINLFKFSGVAEDILSQAYSEETKTIDDLIKNVNKTQITDKINEFEKQRVLSKLIIFKKKYDVLFGETDLTNLFEQRYKHIGSVKVLNVDSNDPFYTYYIAYILEKISLSVKDEILVVIPESRKLFNNIFVGSKMFSILKDNTVISSLLTSKHQSDFGKDKISEVNIKMIIDNDGVIQYPNRDPMRLLFRPTFTTSVINYRKPKSIV